MAYNNATLKCLVSGVSGGPSIWHYTTTDAHGDVDAVGYFSDGADFGLKADDLMFVHDTDTATTTLHSLASATSIDPATLA